MSQVTRLLENSTVYNLEEKGRERQGAFWCHEDHFYLGAQALPTASLTHCSCASSLKTKQRKGELNLSLESKRSKNSLANLRLIYYDLRGYLQTVR